ncbi:universal stress protein [Zunongwangia sp. F260]|uniref:Universal stress protein n=1 Tax=Autumnicola lenta TaxID=3075593 RepID=A0ABU3CN39_9FLAO|nr:universal stress protein [Zunongwangia sp. F260]MDT0647777.1 universal stress protein [Zunongwangia sp. F260]
MTSEEKFLIESNTSHHEKYFNPFDFSSVSKNALDYAVKFSRNDEDITLFLLYIVNEENKRKKPSRKFQKVISKYDIPLSAKIKTIVREGELISSILDIQEQLEVDLIIMGTKGIEENNEAITKRTSKFVQAADLSVLVVPDTANFFKLHNIILTLGMETPYSISLRSFILTTSLQKIKISKKV